LGWNLKQAETNWKPSGILGRNMLISSTWKILRLQAELINIPYGIAVDTAKAVDTAIVLQFY
jgi:hypothetical protein